MEIRREGRGCLVGRIIGRHQVKDLRGDERIDENEEEQRENIPWNQKKKALRLKNEEDLEAIKEKTRRTPP